MPSEENSFQNFSTRASIILLKKSILVAPRGAGLAAGTLKLHSSEENKERTETSEAM